MSSEFRSPAIRGEPVASGLGHLEVIGGLAEPGLVGGHQPAHVVVQDRMLGRLAQPLLVRLLGVLESTQFLLDRAEGVEELARQAVGITR